MASKVAPEEVGADGVAENGAKESHELRRAVGVWGSYTWGCADVGADVYVALGIVMAAAQGATNSAGYLNFFSPCSINMWTSTCWDSTCLVSSQS